MSYNLKDYTRDYYRGNYSPLNIFLRKSDAQKVKDAAKTAGKSVNLFVGELIAAAVPGVEPLGDRRQKKIATDEIPDKETREDVKQHITEPETPKGITISEFAKQVGIGRNHAFAALRDLGYIGAEAPNKNMPTEKATGYIAVKQTVITDDKGTYRICRTPVVTPEGQNFLKKFLKTS